MAFFRCSIMPKRIEDDIIPDGYERIKYIEFLENATVTLGIPFEYGDTHKFVITAQTYMNNPDLPFAGMLLINAGSSTNHWYGTDNFKWLGTNINASEKVTMQCIFSASEPNIVSQVTTIGSSVYRPNPYTGGIKGGQFYLSVIYGNRSFAGRLYDLKHNDVDYPIVRRLSDDVAGIYNPLTGNLCPVSFSGWHGIRKFGYETMDGVYYPPI